MLRSLSASYRWIHICITAAWLAALLTVVAPRTTNAQSGTVTPDQLSATLRAGECTISAITVTTAPAASGYSALDVVLLIDVTNSMQGQIDQVRSNASDIVANIRAHIPDTRLALVTVADYPNLLSFTDYPWRLDQDFTTDDQMLQRALDAIKLTFGGDDDESYLRAFDETAKLGWRSDARHLVLFFGDANPHNPDPGADGSYGTADDLNMDGVLKDLSASNISVLSIYTNPATAPFYQALAAQTKGQAFQIERTNQIPSVVQDLVGQSLGRLGSITLRPDSPAERWLTWQPTLHQSIPPGEARKFDLRICAPTGTAPDTYHLAVAALVDGAEVGTVPITVQVPGALLLPWWWWFLPLLLLLLGLLLWLLRRHRRPTAPSIGQPSRRTTATPPSVVKPPVRDAGATITHRPPPPPEDKPKPKPDEPEKRS